jgi:hypothetical protein
MSITRVKGAAFAAILALSAFSSAQEPVAQNWDSWKFLLGKWVGEGKSDVGLGAGYFTFAPDLNAKVLLRRNHAEYPQSKDHPAVIHDDLMIVFADPATKHTRAFYTDTEGHVIEYEISMSEEGNKITFLSDLLPAASRFRLTYMRTKPDHMVVTFEIAPPDRPDDFHKFIDGKVRKANGN